MTADINGLSCKAVITPACQCSEAREVEEKAAVVKKQLYNNKNTYTQSKSQYGKESFM